jgi:UDP-N-acetyl-D-galactosamine dehydrogenase
MSDISDTPDIPDIHSTALAVIGLGYVGLPLAVEFSRKIPCVGFDLKEQRIAALRRGIDTTREVSSEELAGAKQLRFTSLLEDLRECNVFIIAVPTPIDDSKRPDLRPLEGASYTVAQVLKPGDVVIYESTVYPGATEEVCIPILEKASGLVYNQDFFAGYSPERINPGDHEHRLPTIVKVTSGSTPKIADFVDDLYAMIITAGTFKATGIRVAEAAKVIENTQRDVNIALVNELALIFNRLGINTLEVLEAAGTKWNFLPFRPGLVGGHCIGVDPYYLTHKAQQVGYHPEMILAGRRLNDDMGRYIASQVVKLMLMKRIHVADARILVLGLTFKENCPDLRNTRVTDIIDELSSYGANIAVYDPWADPEEAQRYYGVTMTETLADNSYDAVVLAVAHQDFVRFDREELERITRPRSVIYDVKNVLAKGLADGSL